LKTGLRRSNVIGSAWKRGISWANVNFEDRTLFIPDSLMKSDQDFHVPIDDELADALLELRGDRIPSKSEQVLPNVDIKKAWENLLKRAKIDRHIRPHDLRHTFGGWLSERVPEAVKNTLMAHTAIRGASDLYVHVGIDAMRKGLALMPRLLQQADLDGKTAAN
jgi:integrase